MGLMANIICKGVGIAGVSAVLYDAYSVGKFQSKRTSQLVTADNFESVHAAGRTLTTESPVKNVIQKKVSDLRMDTPIIPVYGSVKGFISGVLTSLGNNILPAGLSACALAGKGRAAKFGAWGVAGYALYVAIKEGFGVSKKSPMD